MTRLKQMPLSGIHENGRRFYEGIFEGRDPVEEPGTATGTPGDWWTTIALRPHVFDHCAEQMTWFGGFLTEGESPSQLDPQVRELGITIAAFIVGGQFCFSQHCHVSRAVGLSDEKINAIPHWGVYEHWTPKERAVLAYADSVTSRFGRVPDSLFEELQNHLSDEDIMELTYWIGSYMMHATFCRALNLEYDDVRERVVEVPLPAGAEPPQIGQDED